MAKRWKTCCVASPGISQWCAAAVEFLKTTFPLFSEAWEKMVSELGSSAASSELAKGRVEKVVGRPSTEAGMVWNAKIYFWPISFISVESIGGPQGR